MVRGERMGKLFWCPGVGQPPHRATHYARGLCAGCYARQYMQAYFFEYRRRPEYAEQRRAYDIRYQLKGADADEE